MDNGKRKILEVDMEKIFKAKSLDDGKWYEFTLDKIVGSDRKENLYVHDSVAYDNRTKLLDKSTISQYTGINDSQGSRIYEGDEFTDFTYAKMYKGSFVVDCGDDGFYLYDEAENLTLSGHNIHDRG